MKFFLAFMLALLVYKPVQSQDPVGLAEQRIKIRLNSHGCMNVPCSFSVFIEVAPNAENRYVVVEIEAEDEFQSTYRAIDGDNGPKLLEIPFKVNHPGTYSIKAVLYNTSKEVTRTHDEFKVGEP